MSMIMAAARLARAAHDGQFRKYNGRPYVEHPARVAARTALLPGATEEMVAAAFLHDVLEDTSVTPGQIASATNPQVVELVAWLTNPSKGMKLPREARKAMDREHLSKAPREAKLIKLLDRVDNLREMQGAPDDFRTLYARESLLLLEAIGDVNEAVAGELARELSVEISRLLSEGNP